MSPHKKIALAIAAPTLIVTSSDDLFHTPPAAEYAAAHIPGAKLVVKRTGRKVRTPAFCLRFLLISVYDCYSL